MPIIRNGQWADDLWVHLSDEDDVPAAGAVTVSLARFEKERDALVCREGPLGVRLKSEELAHRIGDDALQFDLIMLELPSYRDGRAFSAARRLRERYGFDGEIRAFGHVLPDQALFLMRCGVNSIEVKPQTRLEPFAAALREITVAYQPTRAGTGIAPALRMRTAAPASTPEPALAQAAE
jgi:uncharacterized protein (DUF934 family)